MSSSEPDILDEDIKVFLKALKGISNYDFTNYSMKSIKRRIIKIMSDSKLPINELISTINSNRGFMEKVVKNITVNTTELFRDLKVWKSIMHDILPQYHDREKIRIWHPGCSTGQEVYSMMIILAKLDMLEKSEIYASDINNDVLDIARTGRYKYRYNQLYLENYDAVINTDYKMQVLEPTTPYDHYFAVDKANNSIVMKPFLTAKPIYKKIDLVKDDNLFKLKFDLIICRNVIIYFNTELQNRVINLFYQNLVNDGGLILGIHESILGPYTSYFEKKNNCYYKSRTH